VIRQNWLSDAVLEHLEEHVQDKVVKSSPYFDPAKNDFIHTLTDQVETGFRVRWTILRDGVRSVVATDEVSFTFAETLRLFLNGAG